MSPFASMSDQHSVSVSNAHTTKTRKTIRTILQHEQGQIPTIKNKVLLTHHNDRTEKQFKKEKTNKSEELEVR